MDRFPAVLFLASESKLRHCAVCVGCVCVCAVCVGGVGVCVTTAGHDECIIYQHLSTITQFS